MIPVFWNVDSLDWKLQNKEQVLSCLSGQVEEGDVILMHDGYRSSVDAAFALVDHLQKPGFCVCQCGRNDSGIDDRGTKVWYDKRKCSRMQQKELERT